MQEQDIAVGEKLGTDVARLGPRKFVEDSSR